MADPETFLPYGRQTIEDDDIAAVTEALRGDYLTTGPLVDRFETAFADKTGARFAVVCSSGTAAQHLTALALDLPAGSQAIVPAVTFLSTANCARFVGAEVVFADVSPDTGLMEPDHLREALERTSPGQAKLAVPVHLGGQCCDMAGIAAVAADPRPFDAVLEAFFGGERCVAADRGLGIVEDACHAIGATYAAPEGKPEGKKIRAGACAHSDMAVFSLHPVKTITMGEGGVITTNNEGLASRLKLFRNHGMVRDPELFRNGPQAFDSRGAPNPWYYEMSDLGFNYRSPDINCALGLSQLAKLDRFVAARRALADRYDGVLAGLAPVVKPVSRMPGGDPAWHLYVVLIDFAAAGTDRAELMAKLRARGIGTQVHYIPVPWQPYYRERYGDIPLPGAAAYYRKCLSLPLYPGMTEADVDRVAGALGELLA